MIKYVKWNFVEEMDRDTSDEVFSASIDADACYYVEIVPCQEDDEGSCVVDCDLARHIWRCVENELGAGHMRMSSHLEFSSLEEFLSEL